MVTAYAQEGLFMEWCIPTSVSVISFEQSPSDTQASLFSIFSAIQSVIHIKLSITDRSMVTAKDQ